jgi:hypothetical protein
MPLSLEVALWTIMIGAIAVGSWPANLIGSFEQEATRRWAKRDGPTRLERRMARVSLAVAAAFLTAQTLVLWPFIGPRSLLAAVFFSWLTRVRELNCITPGQRWCGQTCCPYTHNM